jgi:hypothetical protein
VSELADEVETKEAEPVAVVVADGETPPAEAPAPEPAAEFVVQIGDDPEPEAEPAQGAPEWVKELRREARENAKRVKDLERQLAEKAEKPAALGTKPTLASCDYDEDRFASELDAWHERKRVVDEAEAKARAEQQAGERAYQERLAGYAQAKAAMPVADFDDAEAVALDALNVTQQGIILQGCDKPELVIYALGKAPDRLKALAAISDPVKYAFAVARLETQMKLTQRKAPPPPEKVIGGGSGGPSAVDSTLERLREEAERTGNYSKVIAYRNKLRAA